MGLIKYNMIKDIYIIYSGIPSDYNKTLYSGSDRSSTDKYAVKYVFEMSISLNYESFEILIAFSFKTYYSWFLID